MLIGQELARRRVATSPGVALAGAGLSYLALLSEEAAIARSSGLHFISHDFALMTFPYGVFAFLFVRGLQLKRGRTLARRLGGISLSVYASHLLFLWLLPAGPDVWRFDAILMRSAAVFAAATLVSLALTRAPLLSRVVR